MQGSFTSGKGVILHEKRSRKYRIKIFRSRLCFRENRLWIFARYACTLSRLVITDLTVDRSKVQSRFSRKQSLKRKTFILYFRLLFSRRIIPFPLYHQFTNHLAYSKFSSLTQFLQAKEEISNANIPKEIGKLNTPLNETVENIVTRTEEAKNGHIQLDIANYKINSRI